MECVDDTFDGVKYPRAEVERGFRFWDAVCRPFSSRSLYSYTSFARQALCAVRQMHADGQIGPDLADAFESAQSWLEPRRP